VPAGPERALGQIDQLQLAAQGGGGVADRAGNLAGHLQLVVVDLGRTAAGIELNRAPRFLRRALPGELRREGHAADTHPCHVDARACGRKCGVTLEERHDRLRVCGDVVVAQRHAARLTQRLVGRNAVGDVEVALGQAHGGAAIAVLFVGIIRVVGVNIRLWLHHPMPRIRHHHAADRVHGLPVGAHLGIAEFHELAGVVVQTEHFHPGAGQQFVGVGKADRDRLVVHHAKRLHGHVHREIEFRR